MVTENTTKFRAWSMRKYEYPWLVISTAPT